MPTIQELVTAITKRAEGRYEVHLVDADEMVSPLIDIGMTAIQLRRINRENAGWRTVLITAFPSNHDNIQSAFRWAADIRDILAEPQTADLYMFMLIDGVESEDAARFETDDRFCRKLVLRKHEDIDSFLDRSFLASLTPARDGNDISDPLLASLNAMCQAHNWVKPHLEKWRELLLSEKSGDEIVNCLRDMAFGEKDFQ
ncbi:ABC-three component system middle component 1 [Enterobacter hormaechei]|uniref:ABC-three component system middle component 1 n=1 Tax=Enterobacter hormaechei TaxID=158836 RepID=UPI0006686292|nr:ABC-three component system middle component 1 [Enterobacter hormaechei]